MQNNFVRETILTMDPVSFERLKKALLEKYISFHVMAPENVTKEILAEKLYDYFEKVQYKTRKKFDALMKDYVADLDDVVKPHVAKTPNAKKDEPEPAAPRSRKYYEKAIEIGKSIKSVQELIDYSRLMMCLYAAIIKNGKETVDNLDFAVSSLDPAAIEAALRIEEEPVLFGTTYRFDTSDPYTMDTCFFVITVIMLYTIIGNSGSHVEEGLSYEGSGSRQNVG